MRQIISILIFSFLGIFAYSGLLFIVVLATYSFHSAASWHFDETIFYGLLSVGSALVAILMVVLGLRGLLPGTETPVKRAPSRFPVVQESVNEDLENGGQQSL